MEYLDDQHYVEVKDKRYRIHPTEKIILRKRDPPKSLGTQYQVQKETQVRKNQNIVESNRKSEDKNYPKKKQPFILQPKLKPPNCPSCKQNIW